ncbi:MAG: hypothetical protein PHR58_06430, partial [Sphaerochaetaceae bacterium]|nr:hypothetical protein [Sphaerochaetaceae bacterium]
FQVLSFVTFTKYIKIQIVKRQSAFDKIGIEFHEKFSDQRGPLFATDQLLSVYMHSYDQFVRQRRFCFVTYKFLFQNELHYGSFFR